MSTYFSFLCLVLVSSHVDAQMRQVVTGYTSNSIMTSLNTGSLSVGDEFGIKVDMWNGVAGVSSVGRALDSYMDVVRSGSVHIFSSADNWNWKYSGTTLKSDYTEDGFGLGLSVGDNLLAVGAPYDSRWGADYGGAVYIYAGSAPSFTTSTIFAEHTEREAYFGSTVAIIRSESGFKNGAIIVGAPGHGHEGHKEVGAAFVYVKNYGSAYYKMTMMLEPSDMKEGANMGYSMAVYGNTLAVGAPGANAVYLFELQLHVEDCPHGHEEQQLPPGACFDNAHRLLQEGREEEGREGENREGEDREQQDREQQEREEREREERERENRNVYYLWKYDLILTFHLEDEHSYKDVMFGASVAVYNDTVLTVVVGVPGMTSATTGYTEAGAAFVMTVMNKGDLWPNYVPDGYHPEGEEPHHLRKLQGPEGDRHHVHYDPTQSTVGWDTMGNFWLREATLYGDTQGGQFGYSVAADYNSLLIGCNNENPSGYGGVHSYMREATSTQDYDRPTISGPLFKTIFVLQGALADTMGNKGDKFGSSLALYKNQALVGSYLKGLTSATNVGTGAAYIYNRVKYVTVTQSPTPAPLSDESTSASWPFGKNGHIDTATALEMAGGLSLVLMASVMAAYGVYKYRGGKKEATVVFAASWQSVKEFGSTVASKLPFVGRDQSDAGVSLSDVSMDDSTTSQSPMNNYMNSSHGSSTSSMSSSSGGSRGPGRFQPQGGRGGFRPQGQPQGHPPLQNQGMGQPLQQSYPPQGQGQQYRSSPGQHQQYPQTSSPMHNNAPRPGPGAGAGRSQPPRPGQYQQRSAPYGGRGGRGGNPGRDNL